MSVEVDREAFMRLMGLTAADVADPDSVPSRVPSCATTSPSLTGGATAAGSSGSLRHAPQHKSSSPVTSSAAGLSHSASLRGDSDPMLNPYTNHAKTSWSEYTAGVGGGGGTGTGTKLSGTFTSATDRSAPSLRPSVRRVSFDTPSPRATASPSPVAASEVLKEEGNRAFEAGLFTEAIRHYTAAIEALSRAGTLSDTAASTHGPSAEAVLLGALHSNRSAAYLQAAREWSSAEEAYGRALCDADRAVALRPSWFKGYSRQGDAYFKLRRYGTAAEAYEMALQLDPRNTTLANALAETRLRAKQAAREESELRRTARATGGSQPSIAKPTTGADDGDNAFYRAADTSAPPFGEAASPHAEGGARRSSGQAQQLWTDLKHEVEVTAHAPTGDAYRLQQLERFRKRGGPAAAEAASTGVERLRRPRPVPAGPTEEGGRSAPPSETAKKTTPSLLSAARVGRGDSAAPAPPPRRSTYDSPTAGGIPAAMASFGGPVTNARDVPYEFSSAAASAYQQQLLEVFRQRKGERA